MYDMDKAPAFIMSTFMVKMGLDVTEATLKSENVQQLLKSGETFDLVILNQFINEAHFGFCHHFKAPCVLLSTFGNSIWSNRLMLNPAPPSYVPDTFLSYSQHMTLYQRTINFIYMAYQELLFHAYTVPTHNKLLHKYFPDAPHLYDLMYNTSLILSNTHISLNAPVPYVPGIIQIGGYHIKETGTLPDDLKTFLDNSKEGVVYFSMGSNLKSKDLPVYKRDALLQTFGELKMKVIWKWEDDTIPGVKIPPNLRLSKWLPQQEILGNDTLGT